MYTVYTVPDSANVSAAGTVRLTREFERRLSREALDVLAEAERFARGGEDEAMVAPRRLALSDNESPGSAPAAGPAVALPIDEGLALDWGEPGGAFHDRLVGPA